MMLYLDTNIIVYSLVNQDSYKMLASQALINQCIADSSLLLSPLSLQELAFTLAKLNVPLATIKGLKSLQHIFPFPLTFYPEIGFQ